MRRTFYCIILITVFPLIMNCATFGQFYCILHSRDSDCIPYKVDLMIRSIIVNTVICGLVIVSVILSVCMSPSVSETNHKIERRLIVQTTVSSILLCCMFGCYSLGLCLSSSGIISSDNALHFYTYGDLFYVIQHYTGIAIILIVCPQFRIAFIKFLTFGCINLEKPRISSISSIFTR